jgi:hypothetical protein
MRNKDVSVFSCKGVPNHTFAAWVETTLLRGLCKANLWGERNYGSKTNTGMKRSRTQANSRPVGRSKRRGVNWPTWTWIS